MPDKAAPDSKKRSRPSAAARTRAPAAKAAAPAKYSEPSAAKTAATPVKTESGGAKQSGENAAANTPSESAGRDNAGRAGDSRESRIVSAIHRTFGRRRASRRDMDEEVDGIKQLMKDAAERGYVTPLLISDHLPEGVENIEEAAEKIAGILSESGYRVYETAPDRDEILI
ncbi:MAG: RNA polymerase sigma factor region1.1 domain-containing protein, partial [Gammaproteobacteria bacterium]